MNAMKLPVEVRERVNNAIDEGHPLTFVAVSPAGAPHVSFRGSAQTFGDDAMAIWVRGEPSETLECISQNPQVALVYSNMPARKFWIFRGRARTTTDAIERARIWEAQHPLEKSRDEARAGVAVIIDIDRAAGSGLDLTREN